MKKSKAFRFFSSLNAFCYLFFLGWLRNYIHLHYIRWIYMYIYMGLDFFLQEISVVQYFFFRLLNWLSADYSTSSLKPHLRGADFKENRTADWNHFWRETTTESAGRRRTGMRWDVSGDAGGWELSAAAQNCSRLPRSAGIGSKVWSRDRVAGSAQLGREGDEQITPAQQRPGLTLELKTQGIYSQTTKQKTLHLKQDNFEKERTNLKNLDLLSSSISQ